MISIYIVGNLLNGKAYVGQTQNPLKRKADHFYSANRGDKRPLYAVRKKMSEAACLREERKYQECD